MLRSDVVKRKGKKVTWGDSPKAFLFEFEKSGKQQWLPKRFCTFVPDEGEHLKGDTPGEVIMPKWLAKKI